MNLEYERCQPSNSSVSYGSTSVHLTYFGICSTGLMLNCLSILVLCRTKLRSSVSLLLASLAVSDIVQLIHPLVHLGLRPFGLDVIQVSPSTFTFLRYLWNISLTSSIYLVVTVIFTRHVTSYDPAQSYLFSTKRTAGYVVGIFMFSTLFNLPKYFERTFCVRDGIQKDVLSSVENNNGTAVGAGPSLELAYTWLYDSSIYYYGYVVWANLVINFLLPVVSLFLLLCIIAELTKERRSRGNGNKSYEWLGLLVTIAVGVHFFYPLMQYSHKSRGLGLLYCTRSATSFFIYLFWPEFAAQVMETLRLERKKEAGHVVRYNRDQNNRKSLISEGAKVDSVV